MGLFEKKTWKNRISEYPTRRVLTKEDGSAELVTVARAEGEISQEGDAFSENNMNDLEDRIEAAIGAEDIPDGLGADIIGALTLLDTRSKQNKEAFDGVYIRHYTGTGITMSSLLQSLTGPCICITNTECISDKPAGKYGVIVIFKQSNSRTGAICLCTDGTMYVNSWNASTSAATGWMEK